LLPLLGLCTTLALAALPARAGLIIGNLDNTPPPVPPEGALLASGRLWPDDGSTSSQFGFGFTMPSGTA
jgi:hypothetical protein